MASQGPRVALLVSIGLLGLWFLRALLIRLRLAAGRRSAWAPSTGTSVTGFVTTFFDTLGIGNFATTTTIFRTWHLVPDELIPGRPGKLLTIRSAIFACDACDHRARRHHDPSICAP